MVVLGILELNDEIFTSENATKLLKKIKVEGNWKQVQDAYAMWESMTECI